MSLADHPEIPYFAYGSNLDRGRMEKRIGRVIGGRCARLPGFRLAFSKRAATGGVYANIVSSLGDEVWGVIYNCTSSEMETLDQCEGVSGGHYVRLAVNVLVEHGPGVAAVTYIAGESFVCPADIPSSEYLDLILRGAKEHGFPPTYIRSVHRLATDEPAT